MIIFHRKEKRRKRKEQNREGKGKKGEIISKLHENAKDMLKYNKNWLLIELFGF